MSQRAVFALGLALLVTEPAIADIGPVPTPSLPSVPSLPVPEVPDPPSVPSLPSVPSTPSVPAVPSLPAVDRVPVPVPPLPSLPSPTASRPLSSGGAPTVSRPSASRSGGGSAAGAAARQGRAPAPARAGARVRTAGPGASRDRGATSAGTAQVAEDGSPRARRRERRLRRSISRNRGCLDGLPTVERRVLLLRSGLGSGPPRARSRVARALGFSVRRVVRLERRGLRRLRGLARGGCGVAEAISAPLSGSAVAAADSVWASFPGVPLASSAATPAAPVRDQVQVKAEQRSSRPGLVPALDPKLAPRAVAEPPAAAVVNRRPGDGTDLTVPVLVLIALLAAAYAIRYELRLQSRT